MTESPQARGPFTKTYRYRFGDIDFAGIAYYPKLLHYFHCCFEDWWKDGLGKPYVDVLSAEKFGLPAVNIQADFYQPIRFGDEPEVSVGVLRIGNASLDLGFWMQHAGRQGPACRAKITTASVNMDTLKSQPIPEHWRGPFARYRIDALPQKDGQQ